MEMKSRFSTHLRMYTEFLKECVFNRSTSNMADTLEPFTHEPCRIIERATVVARTNSNRYEPCFSMLLTTPSELLTKSDIPIVSKCLKTFLTLTARDEQSESSDIPRILSQVTHRQRDIMILSGISTISYPNR